MTRSLLFAAIAVIIAGVAIFGWTDEIGDGSPDLGDLEAMANQSPEPTSDVTMPPEQFTEEPTVDLEVSSAVDRGIPTTHEFLTAEGYDPERLREYLVAAKMPVSKREDFLAQLELAEDDPDRLSAVLKELREELQFG